jgi:hypothetical protein
MAQELAGRALRGVKWRADVVAGVVATWPADPGKRTAEEWEQVRAAIPQGQHLPSGVIRGRTRQIAAFGRGHGRLPGDVFELEPDPRVPALLLLSACDKQQATMQRADERRVLLRVPSEVFVAASRTRSRRGPTTAVSLAGAGPRAGGRPAFRRHRPPARHCRRQGTVSWAATIRPGCPQGR